MVLTHFLSCIKTWSLLLLFRLSDCMDSFNFWHSSLSAITPCKSSTPVFLTLSDVVYRQDIYQIYHLLVSYSQLITSEFIHSFRFQSSISVVLYHWTWKEGYYCLILFFSRSVIQYNNTRRFYDFSLLYYMLYIMIWNSVYTYCPWPPFWVTLL